MNVRVGKWIASGVLLGAVGVAVWWTQRDGRDVSEHARRVTRPPQLDPAAFRAQLAARLQRAREIAARRAPGLPKPAFAPSRSTDKWPLQGLGALPRSGQDLVTPCILGPAELCATLADLITSCDAGNALDCMAAGQYLTETPPRPLIAIVFFMQACRIGDPEGCERYYALRQPLTVPCERDPFACAWSAMRSNDKALNDEACSLGVADSCAKMSTLTQDPEQARAYLEAACQLGSTPACGYLSRYLSPSCTVSEHVICYAPDPAQAAAALEMACSAGWEPEADCKPR